MAGFAGSNAGAAGLDVQHPLHRTRTSESHLTETHAGSAHHAATENARHTTQAASAKSAPAKTGSPGFLPVSREAQSRTHVAASGRAAAVASNGAVYATGRRAWLNRRHHYYERFTASSFAKGDHFADDVTAGEDPVVRQAAIDAMGDMNGTAVVIDPSNGRILAMVNQKLALSPGAEPCSTIKITVAMAALSEGLVTAETPVRLDGFRMNMTQALAKSNNLYFEELGRELGFERVRHYANQFGLGELAGYNIAWRATGGLSGRGTSGRRGRRGPDVQLWAGSIADAVATGRVCGRIGQRRNALLSAAPDIRWPRRWSLRRR